MRIALVSEFYYPHLGGVTEHVHNLAKVFNEQGHPTIVITAHMAPPARGHDLHEFGGDPPFVRRIGTSRVIYSSGSFARRYRTCANRTRHESLTSPLPKDSARRRVIVPM